MLRFCTTPERTCNNVTFFSEPNKMTLKCCSQTKRTNKMLWWQDICLPCLKCMTIFFHNIESGRNSSAGNLKNIYTHFFYPTIYHLLLSSKNNLFTYRLTNNKNFNNFQNEVLFAVYNTVEHRLSELQLIQQLIIHTNLAYVILFY